MSRGLRRVGVCVLALVIAAALAPAARGAVICQRKKKVTLRAGTACKKKEQVVADTAKLALGSDVSTVKSDAGKRLDALEKEAGLACLRAATRNFSMKFSATSVEAQSAPFLRVEGCRAFDGDAAKCNSAFESGLGWDSAYIAPTSCFYYAGRCWPCSRYTFERTGACVNECNPPLCANAPTRKFVGEDNCNVIKDQATCEASFDASSGSDGEARSCYWNPAGMGSCHGCTVDDQIDGKCTNACTPLPTCSARPTLVKACASSATQGACEQTYVESTDPEATSPQSCFWNTSGVPFCDDCDPFNEFTLKKCADACN